MKILKEGTISLKDMKGFRAQSTLEEHVGNLWIVGSESEAWPGKEIHWGMTGPECPCEKAAPEGEMGLSAVSLMGLSVGISVHQSTLCLCDFF